MGDRDPGREVTGALGGLCLGSGCKDLVPVQGPRHTGVEDPQENKDEVTS